jgi:hypothetical protein
MFEKANDTRGKQGCEYLIVEILFGGLSMFLLKEGSRNQFNNQRQSKNFSDNYKQIFEMSLPHQDTVAAVIKQLNSKELDEIKMKLMSNLFEQKWLRSERLFDKYYYIAVDATGIQSFKERHCEHCLTKTSKNGTTTFFHYVLEAKLVTKSGFALSLASEWIENPAGEFDKQDCERKAFVRLAEKLKKYFPRLPICLLADGLYPNKTVFDICQDYNWKFIISLQDKSLKTIQEELCFPRIEKPMLEIFDVQKEWKIDQKFRFANDMDYHKKYKLNWLQCIETKENTNQKNEKIFGKKVKNHFEYVTNIELTKKNISAVAFGGRLRWKIENQGFNTEKNGGYALAHKYTRNSYVGLQNYYTLLLIAHAINQMVEKSKTIKEILKNQPKQTIYNGFYFLIPVYIISLGKKQPVL